MRADRKYKMSVVHEQDVEAQPVKVKDKTSIQGLISSREGPNFALRRLTMAPVGGIPEHTINVEHEQYVLMGHANIGIDGEAFGVHAGDVVFIPEGVPNLYQKLGLENFGFLCIIPTKPDEMKLITGGC
jgi:quercetin dioxygenase-like cupin family protein